MTTSPLDRKDIELERPETWPDAVHRLVEKQRGLLIAYQQERERIDRLGQTDVQIRISPPENPYRPEYDAAVASSEALLRGHRLVGYHCTRLTPAEIEGIRRDGLRALSPTLVRDRLEALVGAGLMQPAQRQFILDSSIFKAHLANRHGDRTGIVWLCPSRSMLRDAAGVYPLFRSWGGEALYASFREEVSVAGALTQLGRPAIVQCAVPLPADDLYGCRAAHLLSNAVREQIAHPEPSPTFDWSVERCLAPSEVIDIITFDDTRFEDLTGHGDWATEYRLG